MLNILQKKSSRSLTVLLTLVIGWLSVAQTRAQMPGTGIWMLRGFNHDYSIALVNLTNGKLTTDSDLLDVVADHCVSMNDDQAQPFVDLESAPGSPLVVDPYQSAVWSTYTPTPGGPTTGCAHFWDGKITFLADLTNSWPPGSQWRFDLNFVSDKKSWLYKTGTWVYITPTFGDSWWCKDDWGFNDDSYWPKISHLWTTHCDDGLMRNITLMQPDEYAPLTVSLYSHDNHNLVVVVQETAAIQETANANYVGYELDWVDNPDDNVPEY